DGKGPRAVAWRGLRAAATRIRGRLSARGAVLLLRVPALGLAPVVLHRRPAGPAGAVRASTRAGVRSMATDPTRQLARARSRHRRELERVPLPHGPDGDDEHGVARDPGHVPDRPAGRPGF